MSNFTDAYEIDGELTEDGLDIIFVSDKRKLLPKMIRYSYVMDLQGVSVFNLGFGDYNHRSLSFSDDVIRNNGDPYAVFHTVLLTIPYFFQVFGDAILMIQGSDSSQKFFEKCHRTCVRRCEITACKKAHRRIKIYRSYLDKNIENLSVAYEFFGSLTSIESQLVIENYIKDREYLAILLKKRKFML